MFEYQNLIQPESSLYVKVPADSRRQTFALYEITNNVNQEMKSFANNFKYKYLTLNKKDIHLILIPFKHGISYEQLHHLNLDIIDENFKLYDSGHSYRDRSQTATPFEIVHPKSDEFDALKAIDDQPIYFNSKKIKEALSTYVKTAKFKSLITDKLALRKFLHTLANDVYKQIYSQSDLDMILKVIEPSVKTIKKEYDTAYEEINKSPALRNKVEPFGKYLKLYQTSHNKTQNISQQMLSMMNENFEPNPKLELPIAADLIAQIYPPALMKQDGKDKDNVVIFNPLTGVWVHDEDIYYALLTAIRPYSKPTDLTTMIATFAAKARNNNSFIEPYHESRFLLFLNCALDVKTMLEYQLDNDMVKDLHFTERAQIHIEYDPEVKDAPEFPGHLNENHGTWDPWTFFMAYANNDEDKLQFLMFGLSLGLFAGHNFGVHFDIKGESRWGKTTLNEIYKALFPGQVLEDNFSAFNEQFGFTNYETKNSIIWLGECNEDAAPLNNEYGIQTYDALANNQASLRVKGKNNIVIDNPPQVFIDGTSYVRAKNLDTGPAGRTLVYHLPMEDDLDTDMPALIKQSYAIDIANLLHNKTVLKFLVNMMISAYRNCLKLKSNQNRLWSLKLNLGGKNSDVKLLPKFAQDWRTEMSRTQGGDVQDWFEYDFEPYFSKNDDNPTQMHATLAYIFYVKDYTTKYDHIDPHARYVLSQKNFEKQFNSLLDQNNWTRTDNREPSGRKTRKSIRSLDNLNFDLQRFKDDGHRIPENLTNDNINSEHPSNYYPLGQKIPGWYKIKYITK